LRAVCRRPHGRRYHPGASSAEHDPNRGLIAARWADAAWVKRVLDFTAINHVPPVMANLR
jgi:hypothetical protein